MEMEAHMMLIPLQLSSSITLRYCIYERSISKSINRRYVYLQLRYLPSPSFSPSSSPSPSLPPSRSLPPSLSPSLPLLCYFSFNHFHILICRFLALVCILREENFERKGKTNYEFVWTMRARTLLINVTLLLMLFTCTFMCYHVQRAFMFWIYIMNLYVVVSVYMYIMCI